MYRNISPHTFGIFFRKSTAACLAIAVAVSFFVMPGLSLEGAEDITFHDLRGSTCTYNSIAENPHVVIMLWASWCHYCRKKIEEMNCDDVNAENIRFFFINVGENADNVTAFLARENIIPCIADNVLLDKNSSTAKKFRVAGIPAFIFLDNGKVVYQGHQFTRLMLEELFGEK